MVGLDGSQHTEHENSGRVNREDQRDDDGQVADPDQVSKHRVAPPAPGASAKLSPREFPRNA